MQPIAIICIDNGSSGPYQLREILFIKMNLPNRWTELTDRQYFVLLGPTVIGSVFGLYLGQILSDYHSFCFLLKVSQDRKLFSVIAI